MSTFLERSDQLQIVPQLLLRDYRHALNLNILYFPQYCKIFLLQMYICNYSRIYLFLF